MSPAYLLDTNAVSELVRNPAGAVASRAKEFRRGDICTSILVVAELRYGATKRQSRTLSAQLDKVLSALDVLPFEAPADHAYGDLHVRLERIGRPIGANDMFIAAHALALDCTLVTANEREFSRVQGLRIENWLRPVAH
jgi:tRNA(fMet)-specific endonuclease VapC